MLERAEALHYLENQLELVDVHRKLREDRLGLLADVTRGFAERVPFQNVQLLSRPPSQRARPTLGEVKADMMSLRGGLCYTQSVFGFHLLKALGYDVAFCLSTVTSSMTYPNNHVDVVARGVQREGDSYLAILPVGYPTFRPVPLHFESETPVWTDSFLEYKYIKHGGKLMRMHGRGDFRPSKPLPFCLYIDGWRRFYETELRFLDDVSALDARFGDVYRNPAASPFHAKLHFTHFPEGRAQILTDTRVLRDAGGGGGGGGGGLEATELQGDAGVEEFLLSCCPQLGRDVVQAAVRNWRGGQ